MASERKCLDCGAPLPAHEPQPVCPRCIFQRFAKTGSTVYTPESMPTKAVIEPAGRDFHEEYELLGEIGRGGMGVIYKAHQPRLNRVVAIKVIHAAELAGEAARRRFESEMRTAGRLNHPNIVPVFDTGMMDGCPCFSMEYFPGGTLAARIREFAANPENGVRLLVKVARAISFAHQRGVLHRDLKPANILLDDTDEPHVADFGLAKQLDSDSDMTRSGAVLGSPNYMSPEQAAGKSDSLTVAADIYSLGVVLYEMLAGRTPFMADTPLETMRLVVEKEAQRPSTMVAKVNRDLETICLKCLRKEPEQRYRTAEELADDLERWLRQEPIQARPVTGIERFQKWARRHPALAVMSALLVIALTAGMGGVLWQWRQAELARSGEVSERRRAEEALARASIALAESAVRDGNTPAARAALDAVPAEWRNATWHYLLGESDTSRSLAAIGLQTVDDVAGDPSRPSVFAAAESSGQIVLFDARMSSRLLEFTPGFTNAISNTVLRLAFSRDGRKLVVGRRLRPGLVIHNVQDGQKIAELEEAPDASRLEFSPDGSLLLQTTSPRNTALLWDVADGKLRWKYRDGLSWAAFASDGQYLVHYSWSRQLNVSSLEDGEIVKRLATSGYFDNFAVQPGGDLLAAANPLGFVRGYSLTNGQQRFEFQPHEGAIEYIAFLPGGERFLTAAKLQDGRQALQVWESRNGRACQTLAGGNGNIRAIALHPLSGELIVCGQENRIWDVATLPPMHTIRGRNAHPSAVFWGDDESIFAPGEGGSSSAHLWARFQDTQKPLWKPQGPDFGQPSVSADGRRAAIGRYNSSGTVYVLERKDGDVRPIASLNPRCIISHVRISPSGDRVAIVHSGLTGLTIVDVATNKRGVQLDVADITGVSDVAWLQGGSYLAGLVATHAPRSAPGSIEQIVLWDTATGRRVQMVTNASVTRVACAAPDGRRFAEAGTDRNVRIRDGASLAVLRETRVHNAPVTALAWHPTRPVLATASEDLVIRLWNTETGERLEELRGPLSPPSVLSFSPGGTRLATAARDGAVRIWEPRSLVPPSSQK